MSRYFRAGKVPAMKKEDTYSGKGREQERACFGEVPGGVILRGAGGGLEDWGSRCSGSSHDCTGCCRCKEQVLGDGFSPSIPPGPRTVS